jgi:RNA polymerase-binding transcription factor DksA
MDDVLVNKMLDGEEARLVAARAAIEREQQESRSGGPSNRFSGESTLNVEHDESLLATVDAELRELAAARQRLAEGRFGVCERCGQAINDDRLRAVPATRYCAGHEAEVEILVEARYLEGEDTPPDAVGLARQEASRNLDLVEEDDVTRPSAEDSDTGPEDQAMHVRRG